MYVGMFFKKKAVVVRRNVHNMEWYKYTRKKKIKRAVVTTAAIIQLSVVVKRSS